MRRKNLKILLSVQKQETPFGPKAFIDQDSCNFDASCLKGDCPSFLTVQIDPEQVSDGFPLKPANDFVLPLPEIQVSLESLDLRIAGIGGTGVVTAAQILATASMLDGFEVRGLDQTGLSQKAGPVVSDLRLTRGSPQSSNLLMRQSADVLIGFDLLVAASERSLKVAQSGKTILVASKTETPTGAMIGDPLADLPDVESLMGRLSNFIKSDSSFLVDTGKLCTGLLGTVTSSNIFLLGVAVQLGALPVRPDSFEEAIRLNNVNVDENLTAFQWGRIWVADTQYVLDHIQEANSGNSITSLPELPSDIAQRVTELGLKDEELEFVLLFAADILAFQNKKVVDKYVALLQHVIVSSKKLSSLDNRKALLQAVARNAHKLIAYKDEYEVARLFLLPELKREINQLPQRNGEGRAVWHLHPPFLRALGVKKKLKIPYTVAVPLMKILAKGKILRGTRLDIFGYAKVRKLERMMRDRYIEEISQSLNFLTDTNFNEILSLAQSPDSVRGFEEIKLKKAEAFLLRLENKSTPL